MWRSLTASLAVAMVVACAPLRLPDDLPSLIVVMDGNDFPASSDATIKVWRTFGKRGLFEAIRVGGDHARGMAAFRLQQCRDEDCETVLVNVLRGDRDAFVRTQATWSLRVVGTVRSLEALRAATREADPWVVTLASEAEAAIRARTPERSK